VKLQDLNNLDFSDIGEWPTPIKLFLVLLVAILVGVAWYYMDTQDQYAALERVRREEKDLRGQLRGEAAEGRQLREVQGAARRDEADLRAMLRQLRTRRRSQTS